MNRLNIILAVVVSFILIAGAIYCFVFCKVNESAYAKDMAGVNVQLLEIHRRNIVQRMHDIERAFPQTFRQRSDYKLAAEELKIIDMKLKALYQKKVS